MYTVPAEWVAQVIIECYQSIYEFSGLDPAVLLALIWLYLARSVALGIGKHTSEARLVKYLNESSSAINLIFRAHVKSLELPLHYLIHR